MEIKLQKWGNSYGIRVPKSILDSLNIKSNDLLNIVQEDNKIIITKTNKNKISLENLFMNYSGDNLSKDFCWDENIGSEIW
jgi:antitoxin MazE